MERIEIHQNIIYFSIEESFQNSLIYVHLEWYVLLNKCNNDQQVQTYIAMKYYYDILLILRT